MELRAKFGVMDKKLENGENIKCWCHQTDPEGTRPDPGDPVGRVPMGKRNRTLCWAVAVTVIVS